ncbi:MAG: amidohydrolase family protein [Bacillota bacterium]
MKVLTADRFFDGVSDSLSNDVALVVEGDQVLDVVAASEALEKYPGADATHFPGCTIVPGLVNCHSHLVMPGDGTKIEEAMEVGDDELLTRAASNARRALENGVTTLADLGGRNDVTFSLRDAIERGEMLGPRLVLAGRPITSVKGHCWPFNGEVSDLEALEREIDALLSRGADLIKIMGNGGGTRGTDPFTPQFDDEMMSFAARKAHEAGKPAFVHCSCTSVVRQAVDAGFDVIVHGNLNKTREELDFDEDLVKRAADLGAVWNPTLEVTRSGIRTLESEGADEETIRSRRDAYRRRLEEVARVRSLGAGMIAGSDEGWSGNAFGNFHRELEALAEIGMDNLEVLKAATSATAAALRVDDSVGSLAPGKKADVLVVGGNPAEDLDVMGDLRAIYRGGNRVD